jgi:hypothetical protein
MGGTGSGNYGGRPTVEDALKLDLHHLIRNGSFRPGAIVTGSLAWTNTYTGEQRASIGYEAHMGDESGSVCLRYTTTNHRTGQQTQHDYRVQLTTTPQPLGGRRWWWVCPRRGDLVSKLYKPNGAGTFASRKAYRLAYRSQRQSPYDRAISKAFKRRHRLGADGGTGDPIDKPHGMRCATFDRKMDQIEAAEAVCDARLLRFVQKFTRRPSTWLK